MTAQKKGTIIGTDAFFRELAVGDEIQDLDGRHYTIDQFGRCKPLDGGNAVPLRNVKEPALVTKYAGPIVEKEDGTVGVREAEPAPAPAPEPEPAGSVTQEPKPSPIGRTGPKPAKTKEAMSKARNKSGTCMICNLVRRMPISGADARKILEDFGLDVFFDDSGRACINRDDFSVAQKLLQDWCNARGEDAEHLAPARKDQDGMSDEDVVKAVEDRGLWLECLEKCSGFTDTLLHNVLVKRGTYTPIPDEFFQPQLSDEDLFREIEARNLWDPLLEHYPGFIEAISAPVRYEEASDKKLADELRHRGYTVTAIKRIEL